MTTASMDKSPSETSLEKFEVCIYFSLSFFFIYLFCEIIFPIRINRWLTAEYPWKCELTQNLCRSLCHIQDLFSKRNLEEKPIKKWKLMGLTE